MGENGDGNGAGRGRRREEERLPHFVHFRWRWGPEISISIFCSLLKFRKIRWLVDLLVYPEGLIIKICLN